MRRGGLFMWVRVRLTGACVAGACLAMLLSACAAIDPVDSRYDTVSRSLAKARNESIFLNLIRASHDYPLSFVTVANVTPTMTNTSTFGLPNFLFGPNTALPATTSIFTPGRDVIFGNTTASNSTAIGTNFNVSTQETSAFYEGFLKPIDLQILDYFIRQGYSRELLFWLFTDAVEITVQGQTLGTRYNPPEDYGCSPKDPKKRCFRDFVLVAIAAGVTVEEQTLQKAASGGAKGSGGGAGGSSKPETTIFARFCFNPVLADRAANAMGAPLYHQVASKFVDFNLPITSFSPKCGSAWNSVQEAEQPQPDTFNFNVGPIKFKIIPRSAYGVFEFIGTLIKIQRDHPAPAPTVYIPPERAPEEQSLPILRTVPAGDDHDLVRVVLGNGDGRCFVHSWFYDGDYCVPEDATNTKRIFSLLAQLIAIQTAATDLSITPIVRVIQ
jgi:hypothetical protein